MAKAKAKGSGRLQSLRRWARAHPRAIAILVVTLVGAAAALAGIALGTWRNVCSSCPSVAQIYTYEPKQATKILDHDGALIAELYQERRTPVKLSQLPELVPATFVAVEDRRFYRHHGFDWIRTASALVGNVLHGHVFSGFTGGGSTITQQLARNMFKQHIGFRQRYTRKLRELHVALELEQVYSKKQILEAYLNQINFGHGWYGLETAAQHYFGKSARDLDAAETALLAALPKAPSRYDPLEHPQRATARRDLVLSIMADQHVITEQEAARAKREPVPSEAHGLDEGTFAPYFVEWVRKILDDRYGSDIYQEGYRVYTTLDLGMQKAANEAMEYGWKRIESQPRYHWPTYAEVHDSATSTESASTRYVQGVFIAIEPKSGEVRALIGGRDFHDSKFNRATQALRQPGSAFKPFVYSAAVASGIPASHIVVDQPLEIPLETGDVYSPRNYEREFMGPVTLREALMKSINTVAVQLALDVGLESVAQYAHRMGIRTPIPRYPSIAIGSPDVIPLQIAGAYTTFANLGTHVEPRPILRVEDAQGRVLWDTRPETRQVMDSAHAYIVTDMMRDVVDHGTGYNARNPQLGNLPYSVPVAGKTGTTNDATDVWFVGFTPDLLAAVWFGFDQPKKIIPGAAGGVYAAPVFGRFMRKVYIDGTEGDSLLPVPDPWRMPDELITREIDDESGQLATQWCPSDHVREEIYIPGTEPTTACDLHGPGILGVPLRPRVPAIDQRPRPDTTSHR